MFSLQRDFCGNLNVWNTVVLFVNFCDFKNIKNIDHLEIFVLFCFKFIPKLLVVKLLKCVIKLFLQLFVAMFSLMCGLVCDHTCVLGGTIQDLIEKDEIPFTETM